MKILQVQGNEMPKINCEKRVCRKKAAANKAVKTQMKTQIKKFLAAVEEAIRNAAKVYSETVSVIDSTASGRDSQELREQQESEAGEETRSDGVNEKSVNLFRIFKFAAV
ncbi:MAG: 30S ribosomal protein S20 [Lachnospiraceae bacterium]